MRARRRIAASSSGGSTAAPTRPSSRAIDRCPRRLPRRTAPSSRRCSRASFAGRRKGARPTAGLLDAPPARRRRTDSHGPMDPPKLWLTALG
jgi:hypothetical protein